MLTDLTVENLGVIETASLSLEPGCSALTGETGAGKTLVVTALTLLAGGRADPGSRRPGASEARVEGRFLLRASDPAVHVLAQNGILEVSEGERSEDAELEVVVSRSISSSGGKARINGRLVTATLLSEFAGGLLDVVVQREHQRLFSPAFQRESLDTFGGPEMVALAHEVADATRLVSRIKRSLRELVMTEQERVRELDLLQYEIGEIEAAGLQEGERARLMTEATRLESSEAISEAVGAAIEALSSEAGAEERLGVAVGALEALETKDPALGNLYDRAASALHEVADIGLELRSRSVEPDPAALERAHERLALINRMCRKYGDDEKEVLVYLERCRERAEAFGHVPDQQAKLQEELDAATADAERKATRLSQLRRGAAERLERATEEVLSQLALEGSRIAVRIQGCDLYEGGLETVELMVDLNGTGEPRSLKRVASGGELSRVALALHLVASNTGAATMVFDEVDAGVGGEAARALGQCLARLAKFTGSQVFIVTHLPQVAAYADHHYRVSKQADGGLAEARIVRVEGDTRISEISRMLAGLPRSGRAHEHAKELLELASEAS
jgi:DNA repair protein RecN (Recombination protein N)